LITLFVFSRLIMAHVTQVAFLIDFNSFPVVAQPHPNLNTSGIATACVGFDVTNANGSPTDHPMFSTPTAGASTAFREQSSSGPSRIGPTVSKDRGERYCLYPTLQAIRKTPPRLLSLESASDSDYSDEDDWPGSPRRQA